EFKSTLIDSEDVGMQTTKIFQIYEDSIYKKAIIMLVHGKTKDRIGPGSLGYLPHGVYSNNSMQDKSMICNIKPEKVNIIRSLLCGHNAPEKEYRFYGEGCAEKSLRSRISDTV